MNKSITQNITEKIQIQQNNTPTEQHSNRTDHHNTEICGRNQWVTYVPRSAEKENKNKTKQKK